MKTEDFTTYVHLPRRDLTVTYTQASYSVYKGQISYLCCCGPSASDWGATLAPPRPAMWLAVKEASDPSSDSSARFGHRPQGSAHAARYMDIRQDTRHLLVASYLSYVSKMADRCPPQTTRIDTTERQVLTACHTLASSYTSTTRCTRSRVSTE